ncbi:MAG: glycosyltransferase family 39 protein [Planctomycetes bacterium]|nr:glycosyltransferase family 39 protein [Planctomycetota bacterium]
MAKPLDDSQLLRLASDLRTRLFSPVRGATVFGPLVVLVGLIPSLAAVLCGEFDDPAAGWALRAVDVSTAAEIQDWLEPGRNGLGDGYLDQAPLSAWFQAVSVTSLGLDQLASWHLVSLALACCTIWATYSLGRRLGGASFGLVGAIVLATHPIMLRSAISPSPTALGLLLIVLAVNGFLGHLEGPSQLVSMRMLAGAIAWGLALLAVGPVAVVMVIPFLVHSWLLQGGRNETAAGSAAARVWQFWLGIRAVSVFLITALSFSGWWQLMMLANHGREFWLGWWAGSVELNFPSATPHSIWREWLSQQSFVLGFLLVGLMTVIQELRRPGTEVSRRRCQFVLGWWLTALAARIIFDMTPLRRSIMIDAWDGLFLLPTVLLIAWGVRAISLRQAQLAVEGSLICLTLGLCSWRFFHSAWIGSLVFVLAVGIVALLPVVMPRLRRGARRWTERDWKLLLQVAVVLSIAGHMSAGLVEFPEPNLESRSLTELRKRIALLKSVPRVTLTTFQGTAPESMLFVLRSRWPGAEFLVPGSLHGRQPREQVAKVPTELMIEWTQHEVRIMNELPADRQATPVGDPIRFRGRRLMIYEVGPRQR